MKCTCASLKPGSTSCPLASITRVFVPARSLIAFVEPTATIRLPRTATASAIGWLRSIVCTLALMMTKSALNGALSASVEVFANMRRRRVANVAIVFIGSYYWERGRPARKSWAQLVAKENLFVLALNAGETPALPADRARSVSSASSPRHKKILSI